MSLESPEVGELCNRIVQAQAILDRHTKIALTVLSIMMLAIAAYTTWDTVFSSGNKPVAVPDWIEVRRDMSRGDLQAALAKADLLLARAPDHFEGLYKKGAILWMLDQKEAAHQCFVKAYQLYPAYGYGDAARVSAPAH